MRPLIGILIGVVVDVALSSVLGAIVFLLILHPPLDPNVRMTQEQMAELLRNSPTALWASFGIGAACSVFAGYLSASIAKQHELLCGALSAWLCIVMGIISLTSRKLSIGVPLEVLGLILSPALGLFGGYLRRAQAG